MIQGTIILGIMRSSAIASGSMEVVMGSASAYSLIEGASQLKELARGSASTAIKVAAQPNGILDKIGSIAGGYVTGTVEIIAGIALASVAYKLGSIFYNSLKDEQEDDERRFLGQALRGALRGLKIKG